MHHSQYSRIAHLCENMTMKMTIVPLHNLFTERRVLKEADYPLLERVLLGPIEGEAKIFIMEKDKTHEVSSEVNILRR